MQYSSPNLIFNLEAHLPGSTSTKNAFYRCTTKYTIADYLNRENAINADATAPQNIDVLSDLNAFSIADYMNARPGSTGSFDKNKILTNEDLHEYKTKLQNTESIVWSAVISFTPEVAAAFCTNKEESQALIKKHLPVLFKNNDYDYDNIDFFGSYHRNTDNPHIHLIFFESTKTCLKNGKPAYHDRYKFPLDNIKNFTADFNKGFDPYKFSVFNLRDEIRCEFNLYCKNPVMLLNFASSKLQSIKIYLFTF